MRRSLALLGFVMMIVSAPASARPWARVTSGRNAVVWADIASLHANKSIRTAWVRLNFSRPEANGATRNLDLDAFDCDRQMMAPESQVSYAASGRELSFHEFESIRWEHIIPDTIGAGEWNFVCSYPIGTDPGEIEGMTIQP